jgi:hypothetical protein
MRSWRESSCVAKHGSGEIFAQLPFRLGDAALRVLLGFLLVGALTELGERLLRLLLEFRQRLVGAALQFLELGGLALLPFARQFLIVPLGSFQLLAEFLLQRLRLFDAAMQFGQKACDIALAIAHRPAGAQHDVFRHAQSGGDFEAGRFARQSERRW